MKNLSWYIHRFSKMSPAEVLYRSQHKLLAKTDEHTFKHNPLTVPSDGTPSLSSLFSLARHMQLEKLPFLYDPVASHLLEKADHYVDNRIDVFGKIHQFEKRINWHLDPKTGKQWPLNFWTKINIRDGFTYGGPKFVWEVNRLYGLPVLGLAYRVTGKKKYADKVCSLLEEWVQENPYPYGVNWTSGIELGVRIANLLWGLSFLQGYQLSEEKKTSLNTFVYTHARHLFRYPSKYSSNNNHAIAEAFGLFLIGVYFPYFKKAKQWRGFGQSVLERECLRQILPDGGSYEYSSTYLSFVFDFFLLFKVVCDHHKIEYDRGIDGRLEKSCEFIQWLMDSKGNIPNIGDQDSAVLVNFGLDNQENFKSILNSGALLFDRLQLCQENFPDIKTLLLIGEGGNISRGNRPAGKAEMHFFKESGLSVIRKTVGGRAVVFVGNATPLGMPPLYAHGHLDALSFTLTVDGEPFLVDPGTYLYHSGGKWRRYFRSTAAHNTVQIDDMELTEMVGDFMFGKPYEITEHVLSQDGKGVVWRAGHNAYRKSAHKVHSRRNVTVPDGEDRMVIEDILSGTGQYTVKQFFHFHPGCQLELQQNRVAVVANGIRLEMVFMEKMELELLNGSEEPMAGWYSNSFNHLEKTNTLVAATQVIDSVKIECNVLF